MDDDVKCGEARVFMNYLGYDIDLGCKTSGYFFRHSLSHLGLGHDKLYWGKVQFYDENADGIVDIVLFDIDHVGSLKSDGSQNQRYNKILAQLRKDVIEQYWKKHWEIR